MMCFDFDISKAVEIGSTAIATLAAAFFGARAAFRYQNLQDQRKQQTIEKNAAHHAMFKLARQFHIISMYRKDFLNPHRASDIRHLRIGANRIITSNADQIDQNSLIFLVNKGFAQCLSNVISANQDYLVVVENINNRANVFAEHIIPTISLAVEISELESIYLHVPKHHLENLKTDTDDNYIQIDKTRIDLADCINDLHKAMKTLYPDTKFLAAFVGEDEESINNMQLQNAKSSQPIKGAS